MEKKFLPARLVKAKDRWYILWYQTDSSTNEFKRIKKTYNLNRIPNKKIREQRAKELLQKLSKLIPHGFPFIDEQLEGEMLTPLMEAVNIASKIRCQTDRKRTIGMYESVCNVFEGYLDKRGLKNLRVLDFGHKGAIDFMDYLVIERKIGNRTYNNYLIRMRSIFNALLEREYIYQNPFSKIKKKEKTAKERRTFTEAEKKVVAKYISENDEWLFLSIVLLYACFIRPAEMRRLRFKNFDFKRGLIHMPSPLTKNKKPRTVTIPSGYLHYFRNEKFTNYPANYLIFGAKVKPHSSKACGHNTMNYRHGKILNKLQKLGLIEDIKGLSLYSWKDTGITDAASEVSLIDLMRQAGHQDPKQTMIYYNNRQVNEGMKKIGNQLLDDNAE